jgi:antitoxin Phd
VINVLVDTRNLVSLTEANQNFSRVARLVDERGSVVILRNNVPRYVVLDYAQLDADTASDDEVTAAGRRLIAQHRPAFAELAQ